MTTPPPSGLHPKAPVERCPGDTLPRYRQAWSYTPPTLPPDKAGHQAVKEESFLKHSKFATDTSWMAKTPPPEEQHQSWRAPRRSDRGGRGVLARGVQTDVQDEDEEGRRVKRLAQTLSPGLSAIFSGREALAPPLPPTVFTARDSKVVNVTVEHQEDGTKVIGETDVFTTQDAIYENIYEDLPSKRPPPRPSKPPPPRPSKPPTRSATHPLPTRQPVTGPNRARSVTGLHYAEQLKQQPDVKKDPDVLLIWWQNVSSWDDLENHPKCGVEWSGDANVFTEKARRIQNAVQLYDLLLNRHGASLKNLISDLLSIADNLDKVSKGTKIAGITGGATGALGGVAAVAGVVLAPFTGGASLAMTAVGVGVATAGGVTGASAAVANKVNVTQDRKKIEKILQDYMSQVKDIEAYLKFINRGMESLRKHNLATLTELNSQAVRVAKVLAEAGSSVWAIEASSSKASEMLGGFALGMDFYFSGSDGQKLKKGLVSKFARKIRQVAQKLGAGLDDLMKVKKLFEKSLEEM